MDDKLYPLIVLLVGIVVVFVGLVSLVFIVKLMALICSGFAKKEKKASVANPAYDSLDKNTSANPGMSEEERRRLITAISAAIGEMTGLDNLRIKSIKRIGAADASESGDERQRKIAAIAAAIAETSGMKSDSFKITSIKRV